MALEELTHQILLRLGQMEQKQDQMREDIHEINVKQEATLGELHEIKIKQERHDTLIRTFTWGGSVVVTAVVVQFVASIFTLLSGAK